MQKLGFKYVLVPHLLRAIMWLITVTCRVKWHGRDEFNRYTQNKQTYIMAAWHNCSTLGAWLIGGIDCTAMVSDSRDGEYVARYSILAGWKIVRGSTSSGSKKASLAIMRLLRRGEPVLLTPDGPRGPRYAAQAGIVWLATAGKAPILPFHTEASRSWKLNSWDQHIFPKPFSTIHISIGKAFEIDPELGKNDPEAAKALVTRHLMENMRHAQRAAGLEPEYSEAE